MALRLRSRSPFRLQLALTRSHVHWMRCLGCACAGFFAEEHCEDITIRGGTFTEIGYLCNETVPSSAADVPSEQVNTYRAVGNTFCEGPGAGYVFNTGSLRPRAGAACVAFHRTGNRVGLAAGLPAAKLGSLKANMLLGARRLVLAAHWAGWREPPAALSTIPRLALLPCS